MACGSRILLIEDEINKLGELKGKKNRKYLIKKINASLSDLIKVLSTHSPKALNFESGYDFYKLEKNIPLLKKGAIFYYDPHDYIKGSIGEGCLKLCWTEDGNVYLPSGVCAGTVIFHAKARHDKKWFKLVEK